MSRDRILVVEDDWAVAQDFKQVLESDGFEVSSIVSSGSDAVHLARQERVDLVLMDIGLAGSMDGIDAARFIRQGPRLPILFITGRTDKDTLQRVMAEGPAGVLLKPVNEQQLREAVRAMIRTSREADMNIRSLVDAAADAIIVTDREGLIVLANEEAARMFGYDVATLIGQPVEMLVPEAMRERHVELRQRYVEHPRPRGSEEPRDLLGRRSDGSAFPVEIRLTPVGPGAAVRVIAVIRDLTSQRVAERALAESREMALQLSRAQKLEAIGLLAGGVAHDFNNLLQIISGHAETLMTGTSDESTQHQLLLGILRAADRGASLTRQLLAFGRRQVLRPQVLNLNVSISAISSMLSRVLGEDIRLATELDQALRAVTVDQGQLEQVLLNLALNARDAMAGTGGTLRIETRNLELTSPMRPPSLPVDVPSGSWVMFSVHDTGCGMDQKTVARAFEPFYTTKPEHQGSGLGLSTVYGIVKQSGGYTWIESSAGIGTTVRVLLPAGESSVSHDAVQTPPTIRSVRGTGTILVVEDEGEVRGLLAHFLEDAGYSVMTAANGHEALTLWEGHSSRIDLIVTDVTMPHMSGPMLVEAVKKSRPNVKVIYLSGFAEPGESWTKGASHLQKPVTRGQLLGLVAELLSHRDDHA